MTRRHRQIWSTSGAIILMWIGLALIRAGYLAVVMHRQTALDLTRPLLLLAPWIAATPFIVWLTTETVDARGRRRLAWFGVLVLAGPVVAALASGWTLIIWVAQVAPAPAPYISWYLGQLDALLLVYVTVAAAAVAAHLLQRSRANRQREVKLANDLRAARQHSLLLQLQPHFIFNSLNAVAELVHRDPPAAEKALDNLRRLADRCGDGALPARIPLAEEIAALQGYVEIERMRFGAVLTVRFTIEPAAREVLVPPFVLQPIVENAIRHGLRERGSGLVEVRARLGQEMLWLEVTDDGAGVGEYRASGEGMGLGLTRRRLDDLFGPNYSLAVMGEATGGTTVRLVLPTGDASLVDVPVATPALGTTWPRTGFRLAALVGLGWTLIGVLGTQAEMGGESPGNAFRLAPLQLYWTNLLNAWIWAAFTPVLFLVAVQAIRREYSIRRLLLVHSVVFGVSLVVRILATSTLGLEPWPRGGLELQSVLLRSIYTYGFVAVLVHAWALRRRASHQEGRIKGLEIRLAEAAQLDQPAPVDPARMTDRLGQISRLVGSRPEAADRALEELGRELRREMSAGRELQDIRY